MIPSAGRIVHYRLSEQDAALIVLRRERHIDLIEWKSEYSDGVTRSGVRRLPAFEGNPVKPGDVYPMMITRVWNDNPTEADCVQGQVFLDGNDTLWKTSVTQEGHTYDPAIVEGVWFEPVRT